MRGTDNDDYKKKVRGAKYIQVNIGLQLIMSIKKSGNIKWYVDVVFSVHKVKRSHTGGFMTMGTEGAYVHYRKQNMNTNSSTETEIVGVYDFLILLIWTQYLLNNQGYKIQNNIIFQDNHSSIKLENNSRILSSKRTRHINKMHYFITDRITKQEVSMELCPTLDITGDYFTKELQGSQFRRFCNIIIGIHEDSIPA